MTATDVLRREHEVILAVIDCLEAAAKSAGAGGPFDADTFRKAADFIKTFADGCHHFKEEQALFPMLEQRGFPRDAGPVGVMLYEHETGRAYVRRMSASIEAAAAGDAKARAEAVDAARGYASLLRGHIDKENHILFMMADNVLSPADQQQVVGKYERHEREELGAGTHQKYLALAEELCRKWGVRIGHPASAGAGACAGAALPHCCGH